MPRPPGADGCTFLDLTREEETIRQATLEVTGSGCGTGEVGGVGARWGGRTGLEGLGEKGLPAEETLG